MPQFFQEETGRNAKKTPFPPGEGGTEPGKQPEPRGQRRPWVWGVFQNSRIARLESRYCLTQGLQYLARSARHGRRTSGNLSASSFLPPLHKEVLPRYVARNCGSDCSVPIRAGSFPVERNPAYCNLIYEAATPSFHNKVSRYFCNFLPSWFAKAMWHGHQT